MLGFICKKYKKGRLKFAGRAEMAVFRQIGQNNSVLEQTHREAIMFVIFVAIKQTYANY